MSKHFQNGLPTDIDIRALFEAFSVPAEGAVIPYDNVTATIKTPETSSRWRTVTARWRKRLIKEHNVYLLARDRAFRVMDPATRVDYGATQYRSGTRRLRKCHNVIVTTDQGRLTAEQRVVATHLQHTSATAYQALRISAKRPQLELPKPRA